MKIGIIGGVGFIGTNVCREAINRGHTVVAFDNLCRKGVENNLRELEKLEGFSFVWGDVRKQGDLDNIGNVDALINFAANPSVVKSMEHTVMDFETNCVGTLHSLELARKLKIPYIYASTNKTFTDISNLIETKEKETRFEWGKLPNDQWGEIMKNGVDLDNEGNVLAINDHFTTDGYAKFAHSPYGVSKFSGELLCQEYHLQFGVPIVAFKMSCIYGLNQMGVEEQAWVSHFVKRILSDDGKINIFGTGKQVRDVLDGRDTARAYLDALENIDKVNGEIMTLGGGRELSYSLLEVISEIERLTGKKAQLTFKDKRPADQDVYISSIEKVNNLLGWRPEISLEQSLKDMIKEYGGNFN
jgi:CDP-paratose 2-epimerase